MDAERLELLTRIASMYFEEGLSQQDIADRTGRSRSMISRLLTEARRQQLVEIRIQHPLERCTDLEQALQQQFGLKTVRVLARGTLSHTQMMSRLCALSARLIEELVRDGMTIGVSWGTTLSETVNTLHSKTYNDIHVVQMLGLRGAGDPQIDASELARRLARAFGGRYSILPAPLIVDSESTRLALLDDQRVHQVLDSAQKADLALLGIGTLDLEHCTLFQDGFFTEAQVRQLVKAGAAGDVCCIFFGRNGEIVDTSLTRRVVGISPTGLRAIPTKIGVAGGQAKICSVLGAIRAGLVNVLVTDQVVAEGVLDAVREPGAKQVKKAKRSDRRFAPNKKHSSVCL